MPRVTRIAMWRHAPWLYEAIERRLFRHIDRAYCVRQTAVAGYEASIPELRSRISFIPTWVDTEVFRPVGDAGPAESGAKLCAEFGLDTRSRLQRIYGNHRRQTGNSGA